MAIILTSFSGPGLTIGQKLWYCIATVGGQYIRTRLKSFSAFRQWGDWYRNLIERVLRARLVYGSPHMNRAVSFVYMNCQLVWNEFSEMLLLLLPMLNSASIKSIFRPFSKDKSSGSGEDETFCPICQVNPAIAYIALPCQHSIATTVSEHDVLQLHHFSAPDVANQLLSCNAMVQPIPIDTSMVQAA